MKYYFVLILLLTGGFQLRSQNLMKAEKGTFLLKNATLVTVTKGTIKGDLLISEGKIADIGSNLSAPVGTNTIDCSNLYVYPGMINGWTQTGLYEVGAVDLTVDSDELGEVTPHVQALTAVNPNSELIPVTRVNGVTTVLSVPENGLFPGTAALINLHGYTPEQMYAGFKAVVMNFPVGGKRGFFDRRSDEDIKKDNEKALKLLNDTWAQAVLYAKIDSAFKKQAGTKPVYNPEIATLAAVVNGETTLMIEVNKSEDIEAVLKWVQEKKIKKVILSGVGEGWRVADKIAAAKIPVIADRVLSLPTRESDRYDKAYANPGLMHKAGVKVILSSRVPYNARNLPYDAGFAAAYGMGKEAALKAVTIHAAEVFGVADRMGSLEKGKDATLFIANGDPFEAKTQISQVFIGGWKIPLDSRQIRLYNEFLDRKPGLKK